MTMNILFKKVTAFPFIYSIIIYIIYITLYIPIHLSRTFECNSTNQCLFIKQETNKKLVSACSIEKVIQLFIFGYRNSPAGIYLLKVNNRNTRTKCEICSNLTINTPHHWHRSGVFFVNFEHISHLILVFLLLNLSR